jgi:hypothetical protein
VWYADPRPTWYGVLVVEQVDHQAGSANGP